MAERRRAGVTKQTRPRARRPAGRDEQEVADEGTTEPASLDEQEAIEDDGSEAVGHEESPADSGGNGNRRAVQHDGSSLTARQAARTALRQIVELTAKRAESITGVERRQDGWTVSIEVVEDRRISSSADILATYETRIDEDGELVSYRRVRRYSRGRGDCN
jgi:hypothetical protein